MSSKYSAAFSLTILSDPNQYRPLSVLVSPTQKISLPRSHSNVYLDFKNILNVETLYDLYDLHDANVG